MGRLGTMYDDDGGGGGGGGEEMSAQREKSEVVTCDARRAMKSRASEFCRSLN